jgi:tetratricopeptide (TPR) repeat protein
MNKFAFAFLFPLFLGAQSVYEEVPLLFEQKHYVKAESVAKIYVANNPEDLKAIELLGDAYGYQEKWDEAIGEYEKLKESKPNNANYHYKYGGALGMKALSVSRFRALGIIGDVKSSFLKAAELDPKHIDTRWALVELYMQLPGIIGGSKKKSLKYAEELQNLSQVDGYLAKGYIYEYDDEPELAEDFYIKAIEVGGSLTCYQKLTNLYEKQGKPEKAIHNIETAQERHQRNALHYQIGKVAADYNVQLEKGEKCLNVYMENHSAKDGVPIEWAYYRMAQIQKHKKNKQSALTWINKALNEREDFKQALREKETILKL